jgi:toxin ParE1/3/4
MSLFSTIGRSPISKTSSVGSRRTAPPTPRLLWIDFLAAPRLLISFPLMRHVGRVPGTYEWVVPRLPYILVYEVDQAEEQVLVTAVFHGAQDRKDE